MKMNLTFKVINDVIMMGHFYGLGKIKFWWEQKYYIDPDAIHSK